MPPANPTITKLEIAVVVLCLAALAATAIRPSIRGNDGVGHYVYLASLLSDKDLDFTDEYQQFDQLKQYPYRFSELPVDPSTGMPSNRYGVGAALLWSPFVALTHGALLLYAPQTADALSRPYEWAVAIGTAFWGSLGLLLLYWMLRQRWGRLACGATIAALILATPLGFYLYAHGSMSHGVSFFAMAAAVFYFRAVYRDLSAVAMMGSGFFCALVVITRFQDAVWAGVLTGALGFVSIRYWRHHRADFQCNSAQLIWSWMLFLVGAFALLMVQMTVWRHLYGNWFAGPVPYLEGEHGAFLPWPRYAVEVLISERGGVLAWHPMILAGLIGLVVYCRKGVWRWLAMMGVVGFLAQVLLVGSWSMWWGGASFGNRFFISALPLLAFGLPGWFAARGPRRWGALVILALLIVWNLGLLVQYATEMVPREDPVSWMRVIRQNLIDVPRWVFERLTP